ncbi:MAG: ATP-binding protein, partial [Pseudomonadota bacterium]
CGKMGAGKSTRAAAIARERGEVLLSEDAWLAALYPGEIQSLDDYVTRSRRLKRPLTALVQSTLAAGTDVVLDFAANTVAQRAWFRTLFSEVGAPHELVYIDVDDARCLEQIAQRRIEQPERAATDTEAMFRRVTAHFVPPTDDEGFNVVLR